jgi:hypothetical protein
MGGSALATAFCAFFAGNAPAAALPLEEAQLASFHAMNLIPVVVFGKNSRLTVAQFAQTANLDPGVVRQRQAASGLVRCGNAHGAGQLTVANNVITTAAHVLFNEQGGLRASSCTFSVKMGGAYVDTPIDLTSIIAGSRNPYSVATVHDWAVAKLTSPVVGVIPYQLADHAAADSEIHFVARGHMDWGGAQDLSMEACRMRDQLNQGSEGTREFSFDCETADGASGGALLSGSLPGRLCAVLVGYRSIDPNRAMPFSKQHYNFAVSVEGAFRDAVISVARVRVAAH